jgi:glucose/mannose transport system substrate-binding protein
MNVSRLLSGFVLGAVLLGACAAPPAPVAEVAPTAAPAPTAEGKKMEIFSWWTNGGEADGLNAMFEIFTLKNPDTEIINATVAGGAGTNAKTVLKTRLQGGQPPDTWQVHAGKELTQYVDAGQMEPLTAFFAEQGFNENMPQLLLDQITYNGEIYSVPVNIHRSNVLWYNIKVFGDNNIVPPTTFDEFFAVADKLKAAGIIPLAVGGADKFEAPHLFESVLLGVYGQEDYVKLVGGDGALWSDARLDTGINTMARMLSYSNDDRASIGWSSAADMVLEGKAAMTIMGDWAHGYMLSKGKAAGTDYGYAPAPGNGGVFMWLSDSFGLAKGAPHPEEAKAWLAVAGSRAGQDAFNPKKGSIPARTDADQSLYDVYLKYSIKSFGSDKLAPSIVHGAGAPEPFMALYGNALNVFSSDLDGEVLKSSLVEATAELGAKDVTAAAFAKEIVAGLIMVGPERDHGWNEAHLMATEYVTAKMPNVRWVMIDKVNGADRPDTTIEQLADDFAAKGVQIIFTNSAEFKDPTNNAAKAHPEITFIHISGDAVKDGTAAPNVGNFMGRMESMKHVSGCAAALQSSTGKISYLGPLIDAETRRLVNSAYLGAKHCWEKSGKKASDLKFDVTWIGFWFNIPGFTLDPTQVVNGFFDSGSDVVLSGIDTTEALVVAGQRAEKGEKVYAIPYDYKAACAEAAKVCLGVPYFNWGPLYLSAVKGVGEGTWKQSWDWAGADWADMKNPDTGAVGWENGAGLSAANQATLDGFIKELAGGLNLFTGPLKYQDGTEFVAKDAVATDDQIWYTEQLLAGVKGASK